MVFTQCRHAEAILGFERRDCKTYTVNTAVCVLMNNIIANVDYSTNTVNNFTYFDLKILPSVDPKISQFKLF